MVNHISILAARRRKLDKKRLGQLYSIRYTIYVVLLKSSKSFLYSLILAINCSPAQADWLNILGMKSLGGGLIETDVKYTLEPEMPNYRKLIINCKTR